MPRAYLVTPTGSSLHTIASQDHTTHRHHYPSDHLAAVAWQRAAHCTVLEFSENTAQNPEEQRTAILHITTPTDQDLTFGHLIVKVPANTAAQLLVFRYDARNVSDNIEFDIAENAQLGVTFVNLWEDEAVVASAHSATIAENGSLRHTVFTLSGGASRATTTVTFGGPHAEVKLLGVFVGELGQHVENRLFVDHNHPNCASEVDYRGALVGGYPDTREIAHGVWVGDVLIRSNATGTDTYESNRNVLLGKGSRMNSVPTLEIETGSIAQAGHASTTGRFDEDQIYYLQTRGIDETTARHLVLRGFIHDIVRRCEFADTRDELNDVVNRELSRIGT